MRQITGWYGPDGCPSCLAWEQVRATLGMQARYLQCTQTDCKHAAPGNHCMNRSCANYFADCPRHNPGKR